MQFLKDLFGALLLSAACLLGTALDSESQVTQAAISQKYSIIKDRTEQGLKIYQIRTLDKGKTYSAVTETGRVIKLTTYELVGLLPVIDYETIEFYALKCNVVCWNDKGYVIGTHPQWSEVNPELLPILEGQFKY